jgi:hypothetical protein
VHDTTGRTPREHWLSEIAAGHVRVPPGGLNLEEVFLHRAIRRVRKDGTLKFRGQLLEVRADLSQKKVELRFDPHDAEAQPKVYLDKHFVCDTVPLDRYKTRRGGGGGIWARPIRSALRAGFPHGLIARDHYTRTCGVPAIRCDDRCASTT